MSDPSDFTLEKLKILEQLQSISTNQAVMSTQLSQLSIDHKVLNMALIGDGSDVKPGISIRVDRLEQTSKDEKDNRNMHRKIMYGSIVGLLVERLWHVIIGK